MKNKLKDILIKNGRGGKRVEKTINQILELFKQREKELEGEFAEKLAEREVAAFKAGRDEISSEIKKELR